MNLLLFFILIIASLLNFTIILKLIMAKFLVTGGAGFIGSNFLNKMVNKYEEDYFVCLDALTYAANLENIQEIIGKSNFNFIWGDIRDKELIIKLFETYQFDYVINFAAESHVDNSFSQEGKFFSTNVDGVKNLLECCLNYKITRFHQVSTDEVYGDLELNSDKSFDENSPLLPKNPYSKSKAEADLVALKYFEEKSLPITISRSTNNYGPCQHEEKFIPHSIKLLAQEENIEIYGGGENIRDWIHVLDHAEAIDLIVRKGKVGEIYNVAGHNLKSNNELAKIILNSLGLKEDKISYIKDRPIHDKKYCLNTSKIEKELGFKCKFDFNNELDKVVKDYYNKFK